MTYSVNGTQYIAVNAGWNSAIVHGLDEAGKPFSVAPARLLVFALDAKGVELPPAPPGRLHSGAADGNSVTRGGGSGRWALQHQLRHLPRAERRGRGREGSAASHA